MTDGLWRLGIEGSELLFSSGIEGGRFGEEEVCGI
jgi:hypothetical protein